MKNHFSKTLITFFLLFISLAFTSCVKAPNTAPFISSKSLPKYDQNDFLSYIEETKKWVSKNRNFISSNKEAELEMILPFEVKSKIKNSKKAILLVHGLTDSPAYYRDISNIFSTNGFLVRTIVLPGHISKPADLMLATSEDWENVIKHHINLLKEENYDIWLGGFSTGANLVTSYAIDDKSIKGLYLSSPAFYSKSILIGFSPLVSYFIDWIDVDEENNVYKYDSMPMNAVKIYYKTTLNVQERLEEKTFDRPAFFVFSKDDSVVDYERIINIFKTKFTNNKSRFILYANKKDLEKESNDLFKNQRFKIYDSFLPKLRISNFSHLSILFSKENTYYGENGSYIMLNNGQVEKIFVSRDVTWFSAWGLNVEGKYHARLTYNPYFEELEKDIEEFLNSL